MLNQAKHEAKPADMDCVSDSDVCDSERDSPNKNQREGLLPVPKFSSTNNAAASPTKSPSKPMDKQALAQRQAAIATARNVRDLYQSTHKKNIFF